LTLPALDGVAPSQMTAAIVNVTAVGAQGPGYLRVYPAGTTPPATSTLNYATAAPIANRAVTRLSSGRLTVGDFGAATDFVIDVVGWYAPPATGGGSLYHALTPSRVLDTRTGLGAPQAALAGGSSLDLVVAGNGQPVPAGASAVVMTLTSTDATVSTYLTAWPSGLARPATSDVSVTAPEVTANLVVVPIGSGGKVSLFNHLGATQLVGDVVGFYQ
ncbi:MAG TPA: hypothetical protein VLW53_18560, partial [Candidatus Eisenbacteria bacterium]|nr:hypothetical protein [Candidatus Eisenbacteria bacterium]